MSSVSKAAEGVLQQYLQNVQGAKSEIGKREAFAGMLGSLFSGALVGRVAAGAERSIRIQHNDGTSRRSIDTFHGNAVIEFERDLRATGAHAEEQLREYCSGVWNEEGTPYRPMVAVATDGVRWRVYSPRYGETSKALRPQDIVLGDAINEIEVRANRLGEFYFWLESLFFRPQQIFPSSKQFAFDFGDTSPLYAEAKRKLREAWAEASTSPTAMTAFDAWKKYLRYTYAHKGGQEGLLNLFLRHTYLASIARLLAWVALQEDSEGKRFRRPAVEAVTAVLDGTWFQARRLANLVDDDFFSWVLTDDAAAVLAPLWEQVTAVLTSYDISVLGQDVLKDVYEILVNPSERHALGEYYTPDWLCERIVAEVLPRNEIVRTLDPSCGSGSFLRAAIVHYRKQFKPRRDKSELAQVLTAVVGIDIHPLAVTVARVTYALAVRDLIKEAELDVQIPVYLCDALFVPSEVSGGDLFDGQITNGYEIRFGPNGRCRVAIPKALVETPERFDPAIGVAAEIARSLARDEEETRETLHGHLRRQLPDLFAKDSEQLEVVAALWAFANDLEKLIRKGEDGIWPFIVRNAYRPAMLRRQFQRIVGNPPWLSYRFVEDAGYQGEIRERLSHYGLIPTDQKGRPNRALLTQLELATVFLAHVMAQFAADDAELAFVMPRGVLTGDQHAPLRTRSYKASTAPFTINQYWDLIDVKPLFKVPSCVIFARRKAAKWATSSYTLPAQEWSGVLTRQNIPWSAASPLLTSKPATGRLLYLGRRNALGTAAGATSPSRPSTYLRRFAQGATLVPRNLYFVTVPELSGRPKLDVAYEAQTDAVQAQGAKRQWKDEFMSGRVEGRFLFKVPLARHLLPFALGGSCTAFLPFSRSRGSARMYTVRQLKQEGWRHAASWMDKVEAIWEAKKPNSAKSQSAVQWLDYHQKLTSQAFTNSEWLVMYNHSGTNVTASYGRTGGYSLPIVMDAKLYYTVLSSEDEAAYLCAILNSQYVNKAIKPFQSTGLQGERDVHTKPLELPIPSFNPRDAAHTALAKIAKIAQAAAAAFISGQDEADGIALKRSAVRKAIHGHLKQIEPKVRSILRGYVRCERPLRG